MRCSRCGYEWNPRVPSPKECPRCKTRLDYKVQAPPGAPIEKKVEVVRRMPSKLPWLATAVIIVVAVAAGFWLWTVPGPTAVHGFVPIGSFTIAAQRVGDKLVVTVPTATGLLSGPYGSFGIENIYIIKQTFTPGTSGDAQLGNVYATINNSGDTVNIPYEENFGFCVEFIVRGDNVAYFTLENVYEYFTTTGGAFSATENQLESGNDWYELRLTGSTKAGITDNATAGRVGKYYPFDIMRIQAILDNYGNWFKLAAGASVSFQVTVYSWK